MKHLLSICDAENHISQIIDLAQTLKNTNEKTYPLKDETVALIFEKSSTRTRVSFEVGVHQLGGQGLYLSAKELQMGRGEPISDTAKVLSRYVDMIMIRARKHEDVEELAQNSTIPIINGLTDYEHPCQAFADVLTILEYKKRFTNTKLVYMGDGNNVCNSLLLISAYLGMDMTVACPDKYQPPQKIQEKAQKIAKNTESTIIITNNIKEALQDADVIYTDVWVSMGDEDTRDQRLKDLKPYQVNQEAIKLAKNDVIFMHCLPAIRGEEVTSEVIDGPHSVVWDQAENRLHAQKAIMQYLNQK